MKNKTTPVILLILFLFFLMTTCKKPKGDKYCTWPSEPIGLNASLNADLYDTCKYDTIQITLKFDTKYIGDWPPCGSYNDSVVGYIDYLDVVVNYFLANDTIYDTINNIVNYKINYYNNEVLSGNILDINFSHPRCNSFIYLYLTAPTDNVCMQSFSIKYKGINSALYTATTKSIYLIH